MTTTTHHQPAERKETDHARECYERLVTVPMFDADCVATIQSAITAALAEQSRIHNDSMSDFQNQVRAQAEELSELQAKCERLEGEIESFPLRIYDAFACPNCRGSKQQSPPFMGESKGPVACEFCKGEGTTNFAQILDNFDKPYPEAAVLDELDALRKLRDAVDAYKNAPDMHGDEEAKWAAVEAALAECGK